MKRAVFSASSFAILSLTALVSVFSGVVRANATEILYVTYGDGTGLATINPSTGIGTIIGPSGTSGTYSAAHDPTSGTLYGIRDWATANNSLATWNTGTGAATAVAGTFGDSTMLAMEVANDGTIYAGSWDGNLYRINKITGAKTLVGAMGFGQVMDFAFNSSGTLYAIDNSNGNRLYTLNLTTGAGTLASTIAGADGLIMGIMFDSADKLYATTYINNSSFYQINPGSGASTFIGKTGLFFSHGGDFTASAPGVPEGGVTLVMLGAAVASLGMLRQKR